MKIFKLMSNYSLIAFLGVGTAAISLVIFIGLIGGAAQSFISWDIQELFKVLEHYD